MIAGNPHPERPSCGSSGCPWLFVPEDGVKDGHQLADAGDNGDLSGLSGGSQPMIGLGQQQLAPDRDQDTHVKGSPDDRSSASDGPSSSQGTAVPIERG